MTKFNRIPMGRVLIIISLILVSINCHPQTPCTYDTLSHNISLYHCDTTNIKLDIARFHGKLSSIKVIKAEDFINYYDQLLIWVPNINSVKLKVIEKDNELLDNINIKGPITLLGHNKEGEVFFIYSKSDLSETLTAFKSFTNDITRVELISNGSDSGFYLNGYKQTLKIGNPKTPTGNNLTLLMSRKVVKEINKID